VDEAGAQAQEDETNEIERDTQESEPEDKDFEDAT
jgi:hypothetical protein